VRITPDLETYRPFLREAGAEFGIPLRFIHGDALAYAADLPHNLSRSTGR